MTRGRWLALAALGSLTACALVAYEPPSLYDRLGGREGIRRVVDDFLANAVADGRVNGRFAGLPPARRERLTALLADQICAATGGPCLYLGRDMATAHRGMRISEGEWTATVEVLDRALQGRGVSGAARADLLGLLGAMKKDIVGQ